MAKQVFVRSGNEMDASSPFQCDLCKTAPERVEVDRDYLDHFNHQGHVVNRVLINETYLIQCHHKEWWISDSRDVERIRNQIIPKFP